MTTESPAEHASRTSPLPPGKTADRSRRTVLVALGAGLGVAVAKAGAAALTASPALAAEAAHSLGDTANDVLLFIAQRRGAHAPDDRHPLGYGREAYFWALIGACGAFVAGALFSLRDGINQLISPTATSSFAVAYVVLAISTVLDLVSIRQSGGELIASGRQVSRGLFEQSKATSDPTMRAVFMEDVVSVSGDLIAFAALAVDQITGSSLPQAAAAVIIGLALVRISVRLISRSHDFLVGIWVLIPAAQDGDTGVSTEAIRPVEAERIRELISTYPGVTGVRELFVSFLGPGRIWVVGRVEIDETLRGSQIRSVVRGIESSMKRESDHVHRVDVVPIGAAGVTD